MKCCAGRKILQVVSILMLFVLPAACETAQTAQTVPPPVAVQPYPAAKPCSAHTVTLRCGDVIEIKFAYAPQFDQVETVRPDGKIELQLIGEVVVQGKTPAELRSELMKRYAVQLKHPQLAVIVKGLWERRVYVGGEVKKPGIVPMPGEMTALEAIMDAGGFDKQTAEMKNVIVVRNMDGRMVGRALDLREALNGAKTKPFYLKPRDIVYVPQTCIVNVDTWVQQHLWRLLPPVSVGYSGY